MEQKNKPKQNVRIEPKVATSKETQKKSAQNEKNSSPAHNKANEMESGFIKTRKTPPSHETSISKNQSSQPYSEDKNVNSKHSKSNANSTTPNDIQKGLQITLSPSACITALVTLAVTISFIFLFGLIIGKGMVPAPSKIEPEKLLPQIQIIEEKTEILPKEELQFMTSLKTEPTEEGATENADTKLDATTDQNKIQTNSDLLSEIIPSTRIYDFNIRVAAFRNANQADTLREKLEGIGFRTLQVIEKGSKKNWYFVHVLLRGTETKLKEAQESFKKFAIRDSIIKTQKEVK